MNFNENELQEAKEEVIEFLEFTIFRLALFLNLDIEEIDAGMEIPVPEEDQQYEAFLCLKKQLSIHESLVVN